MDEVDIEECVGLGVPGPLERIREENKVLPRALKRKLVSSPSKVVADSFIPGTQSIYIKTWGCSHNNSDGEYMAGLLAANGYTITGDHAHDLIWSGVVNSFFLTPLSRLSTQC